MGYVCKKSKQEIIDTVVKKFLDVNTKYGEMDGNTPEFIRERSLGECGVMYDILRELGITEE